MKLSRIGAHIKCADLEKSTAFYEAFSFKPVFVYGDESHRAKYIGISGAPEVYNGVTYSVGESLLEVADGHLAVKADVFKERIKSSKLSLMVDVDSVEDVLQIATTNSFDIAVGIKEYPWGSREIVIRDPDGVIVVFRELSYME